MFLPHPRVKVSIVGSLCDREVACSASDRQGSNFESCVWRTVSSQSSHHPQEVLLAQFSLYVHKGGLKPDSFHFHNMIPKHATSRSRRFPTILNLYIYVNVTKYFCFVTTTLMPPPLSLYIIAIALNPHSAGIVFRRQNLTSVDVRFWRPKSIPAL